MSKSASGLLAVHLRNLRADSGFTLRDVEKVSRELANPIPFDNLSRLETGSSVPSPQKLITLAKIYQVPVQQFLDLLELEELQKGQPGSTDPDECLRLSSASKESGDYRSAYAHLHRGLLSLQTRPDEGAGDGELRGRLLVRLGSTLSFMGKLRAAEIQYQQALEIPDLPHAIVSAALTGLANIAYQTRRIPQAEALAIGALKAAKRDGGAYALGLCCLDLSNIRESLGQARSALNLARKSIEYLDRAEPCHQQVIARYNLGLRLDALGQVLAADAAYAEGIEIAGTFNEARLVARGFLEIGRSLFKRGDIGRSKERLTEARTTALRHELRSVQFLSSYYLWKISLQSGAMATSLDLFKELKSLRLLLDQQVEEMTEFDHFLIDMRARRRARRPP